MNGNNNEVDELPRFRCTLNKPGLPPERIFYRLSLTVTYDTADNFHPRWRSHKSRRRMTHEKKSLHVLRVPPLQYCPVPTQPQPVPRVFRRSLSLSLERSSCPLTHHVYKNGTGTMKPGDNPM
ncbi:hypothetical protein E4U32_003951 [Claviceps aff. humidiphila group G2b]|nr:hypothetical protein E4U32_003951 [Claviceps aff. humidiphila group G2b]